MGIEYSTGAVVFVYVVPRGGIWGDSATRLPKHETMGGWRVRAETAIVKKLEIII